MNMANVTNKVSRNAFDLSYRNITSCCVGQLIPFFCKEVMPGDNVRLKTDWFTRTVPINTAAYTRIREHIDYFFVPIHLLWRYSEIAFTQINGNPQHSVSDKPNPSAFNGTNMPTFTIDNLSDFLQKFRTIPSADKSYSRDCGGNSEIVGTYRLLDALGYGIANQANSVYTPYNALRLLAYQKIYYDYYRFDQWEDSNPNCFNVDYYVPSMGNTCFDSYANYIKNLNYKDESLHNTPFTLRYANYPKDMFMGLLPTPQYGGTAYAPVDFAGKYVRVSLPQGAQANQNVFVSNGEIAADSSVTGAKLNFTSIQDSRLEPSLNVLELRKAQALQKWKEVTNAHKKSYKAQIEAHFGTNVSETASDMVTYLGGSDQTIDIGEVINNNLTAGEQANIQGKGVSSGNGYIEYQVKNYHGIIMGIYHAQPIADYTSDGVDPFNLKTDFSDYAIPEFDKLGMQPVPFPVLENRNQSYQLFQSFNKTSFLGYAPRYWEYKISKDVVSKSVRDSFKQWQASLDLNKVITPFSSQQPSITYRTFKIKPWQLNEIFVVQNGNPSAPSFDNTDSDQLLINFNNTCQMVRPLDFNGLPY